MSWCLGLALRSYLFLRPLFYGALRELLQLLFRRRLADGAAARVRVLAARRRQLRRLRPGRSGRTLERPPVFRRDYSGVGWFWKRRLFLVTSEFVEAIGATLSGLFYKHILTIVSDDRK
jgi:hypothetical protein